MRRYGVSRSRRYTKEEQATARLVAAVVVGFFFLRWLAQHPAYLLLGLVVAGIGAAGYFWWARVARGSSAGTLTSATTMRSLSPVAFERSCAALFQQMGYRTSLTRTSGDGGVDIIIQKGGRRDIVQCKHYFNRGVGNNHVRDMTGAKHDFGAGNAYLLTSGFFTQPAIDLASRNAGIHLWDQKQIIATANRLALQEATRRPAKKA
jgi:hypothetical protein